MDADTIASKDALAKVMHKIMTRHGLRRPHPAQPGAAEDQPGPRGWAAYFRYGGSKKTFAYLGYYAWWRMISSIRLNTDS